jgi:hypothetical protein
MSTWSATLRCCRNHVRPHEKRNVKNQEFSRRCQEQTPVLALARSSEGLSSSSNGNALARAHCLTKNNANSSFAPSRLAQAARPLAGSSPVAVLERNQILQVLLMPAAVRQTGRMNKPPEFLQTLARSKCQPEVRPNPSIEPTSTGWARYARCSLSASRAQPVPAAHVKR